MQSLIITLDGPAGSGKSTVAHALAKRLGLAYLDTGAMYRGLTAYCLDNGITPAKQPQKVLELALGRRIWFDWQTDPPRLHIDQTDVAQRLHDPDTTANVSSVAEMGPVRQILTEAQRCIGRRHERLVSEGRDQGTLVFPDADAKYYLDAAGQIRARRRHDQWRQAGIEVDEDEILRQILARDRRDTGRKDGPLACAIDALRVDTSNMTVKQVVDYLEQHLRQHVAEKLR